MNHEDRIIKYRNKIKKKKSILSQQKAKLESTLSHIKYRSIEELRLVPYQERNDDWYDNYEALYSIKKLEKSITFIQEEIADYELMISELS